jgi:hypothetical protein
VLSHVAGALGQRAQAPELAQLLSFLRVHTLRLEPRYDEDEESAERLLAALG